MGWSRPEQSRGRPRLLIVTPDFPPISGGIQVMTSRLACAIDGFDVRLVAPYSDGAEAFDRDSDLNVRRVRVGAAWSGQARNALLNVVALAEALRLRPDVAVSMHIATSPAVAVGARLLGIPWAQIFHAEEITARPRLAAFAARAANASIAVSGYTASLIADTGARPRRLELIAPGVDRPTQATALPSDRPTIVTVSRLEERYKGHDMMIRALSLVRSKIPDVQWIVIGEGSLRGGLEQLASAYGLSDCVRFVGACSDHERDLWLRRANLFAMPSRVPAGGLAGEGFGIVFLEAAAVGKPVLAGNVGGAVDAVVADETGVLVDPRDPLAVAAAITQLLTDTKLATRLGEAGADRARAFSWGLFAQSVRALLLELLAAPRSTAGTAGDGGSGDAR